MDESRSEEVKMRTIVLPLPMVLSAPPYPAAGVGAVNQNISLSPYLKNSPHCDEPYLCYRSSSCLYNSPTPGSVGGGICRASSSSKAAVELFPPPHPQIVIREARLEDCWQVAETHCSSFFPDYSFPLDLALRIDRLVGLLSGFSSIPHGCRRTCLVALLIDRHNDQFFFGAPPQPAGSPGNSSERYVAGILTVDTVADFLPRKGPLRRRRSGIAYVSNVAVRERDRCKGIAKKLLRKAESEARSWGCRAIALHCDMNNPAATWLYKGQGFKCIKVPERANWPQPKTSQNVHFSFMMKLLCSEAKR